MSGEDDCENFRERVERARDQETAGDIRDVIEEAPDVSEKSNNESDEFHPSMKRLAEKLEFQGATVSKTIRSKDEDTARDDAYGDRVRSEAEKRDTCDNGRCNGGPSPAASEPVEPAAYLIGEPGYAGLFFNEEHFVREKMYESLDEAREAAAKHENFDFEPLVRLSDVIAIIEEHRDRYEERRKKAFDNYMQAESEKNQRVHQSVAAQNQDRVTTLDELLEEFTQKGGTE